MSDDLYVLPILMLQHQCQAFMKIPMASPRDKTGLRGKGVRINLSHSTW
jgi:hypothetical protein